MGKTLLAHGAAAGSNGLLIFLPFLPFVAGVVFLWWASARDRARRRQQQQLRVPDPRETPLRGVHVAIASHKRERMRRQRKDDKPTTPRLGSRHLKQV
jgi:hypothetical protein